VAQEANSLSDDAVESFDRVIMICPEDAQGSYFKAAELLVSQEKQEDGIHYMQQSCLADPGSDLGRLAMARLEEWGSECPLGQKNP